MEWLTIPPILTPQARWELKWLALDINLKEMNAAMQQADDELFRSLFENYSQVTYARN